MLNHPFVPQTKPIHHGWCSGALFICLLDKEASNLFYLFTTFIGVSVYVCVNTCIELSIFNLYVIWQKHKLRCVLWDLRILNLSFSLLLQLNILFINKDI